MNSTRQISATAIFALTFAAPVVAQQANSAASDGPGLRRATAESLRLPVPRRFDLSHVEPVHFAAALGKDSTRIFNFVRDEIAYEPYAGALRGPRGTLLAMAGNSIDRASLLAALLAASGQRVRFAYGVLPRPRVDQLVASIWLDRAVRTSASPVPANIKASGDALFARIERDGSVLQNQLRQAGLPGRSVSAPTAELLVKETQQHYWVQWLRDGAWIDLDPSFASSSPGQRYAEPQDIYETLPESLFHRVDLRVRVEEYTGPQKSSRIVLHYAAKAVDLSALDLILAHEPGLQNNTWTNQYTPLLIVNGQVQRGDPFWLLPPKQVAAAAIVDAFGGGSDSEPSPVAMAEFVEMDFIGAEEATQETVVREIFDRVGKRRRIKGETLTAEQVANASEPGNPDFTQGVYDFFIATGAIDRSHVRNFDAEAPSRVEPGKIDVGAGFRSMNITFAALSDALLGRFTDNKGRICRTYFDTPRVLVTDLSGQATAPRLSLDLRRDTARVVVDGLQPQNAFSAQVLRGVVEGSLERLIVETFGGGAPEKQLERRPVFGTSWVFEKAEASKTPVALFTGGKSPTLAGVADDARSRVDEAIAAGAMVVAPTQAVSVAGKPAFAWWQVDPQTGKTTAVTSEGLHGADVEAIIVRAYGVVGVAISVGGQYLPRAAQFASEAEARAFCALMELRMLAEGLSFNWFQMPF